MSAADDIARRARTGHAQSEQSAHVNLTDSRRLALRLLADCDSPNGLRPIDLAEVLSPRAGMRRGWAPQSATRWIGQYLGPLARAGLVQQIRVGSEFMLYWQITADGRDAIS